MTALPILTENSRSRKASHSSLIGICLLIAAGLAITLPGTAQKSLSVEARCSQLLATKIGAAQIGKPTSGAIVKSAGLVSATAPDNVNGEFCKVNGHIKPVDPQAPDIEFEVNLPSHWNQRALQFGGGGYDGTLITGLSQFRNEPPDLPTPLSAGYVTLGSDGGHEVAPGEPRFSGKFALNDEALRNYGLLSIKKTHDAAMVIAKAFYGNLPKRMYFIGSSQGGHEALLAAAMYPEDYDGVVANYPAYDVTMLQMGGVQLAKALYDHEGAGWLNPVKVKLLTDAVYAACDSLDGAADGVISDIIKCRKTFTIETVRTTLRCPSGKDVGDTCLSDAQIGTINTINSPYVPGYLVAGLSSFPRWPILEGALFSRGGSFGTTKQPHHPLEGTEAAQYLVASGITKFFITRNPDFDPLQFRAEDWKAQVEHSASIVDISNVSLSRFQLRGGKIIMSHGTIDDSITPYNSIAYYDMQLKEFGQAKLDSFLRFYLVPGLAHGDGVFSGTYDSLSALVSWVEDGEAPGTLVSIDMQSPSRRSRPMCKYPAFPKFTGRPGSSLDERANFSCALPDPAEK